jgi:hypothetical protein
MPSGGDKLPAASLAKFAEWIDLGAAFDSPLLDGDHWAFRPLRRPSVPEIRNPIPARRDEIRNEIDRFIVAKLDDTGLSLSPEADRRTLIRRLKFDLLGLPPTPQEVEAFAADK